jgi:hypothetical protein
METPPAEFERHDGEDDGGADQAQRDGEGDERETLPNEQEAALDAREVGAAAREAVQPGRSEAVQRILADADRRDDQADARDSVATTRDTAASLHAFLHDGEYGPALKARRSAAMDRSDSKTDRILAAADRSELAEDGPTPLDDKDG